MKFSMPRLLQLFLIAVCLIVLIVPAIMIFQTLYQPMLTVNQQPVVFTVDKAMSGASFIGSLSKRQLITSPRWLLCALRIQRLSHQLKAGSYQIYPGESFEHFLLRVVAGDVLTLQFQIIDGTTAKEVGEHLSHARFLSYRAEDWNIVTRDFGSTEGALLADTYQYNAGSTADSVLMLAHLSLSHFLREVWASRKADLPYHTSYELLIAASIIEKETAIPEEQNLISGVIVNRLNNHMPLQMDPTVIYALGTDYTGHLTHEDLHIDSPFNTYRYRGLPPTPIAMVGKAALLAAAHPTSTNYLYFVARGDGRHEFSVHYIEQQRAVKLYQKKK
jgi:UPF0755 protein